MTFLTAEQVHDLFAGSPLELWQEAADPLRFLDLSLAVIKLLGSGEYKAESAQGNAPGHFGLAVKDYAHVGDRLRVTVPGGTRS